MLNLRLPECAGTGGLSTLCRHTALTRLHLPSSSLASHQAAGCTKLGLSSALLLSSAQHPSFLPANWKQHFPLFTGAISNPTLCRSGGFHSNYNTNCLLFFFFFLIHKGSLKVSALRINTGLSLKKNPKPLTWAPWDLLFANTTPSLCCPVFSSGLPVKF